MNSTSSLRSKNDQCLIYEYIHGNEFCLEELIRRNKTKVFTNIKQLVKDHFIAEDILQETLLKVVKTLKSGLYKEEGRFSYWIMQIAHNLVIDHFRKEQRTPSIVTAEGFDIFDVLQFADENIAIRWERDQWANDLKAMIHRLPTDQKEVLIMRYYGNISFKEIARTMDISVNTALGRMRYALIGMRKMLFVEKNRFKKAFPDYCLQ